jgi:hypothetical protein
LRACSNGTHRGVLPATDSGDTIRNAILGNPVLACQPSPLTPIRLTPLIAKRVS